MSNSNKIFLVLIAISSGALIILYSNNDLFSRPSILRGFFQSQPSEAPPMAEVAALVDPQGDIQRVKYIPKGENATEHNIFVIYTKENYLLKSKFELFLKSLLKFTSIDLHLHIITDEKSETSAETVLKSQINKYRKRVFYTLYDVEDFAAKINDIVYVMMPFFSSHAGSYYSDALFFLSLGLHRIVDPKMNQAILIDCDVVFRTDVKLLFEQFRKFSSENLFGLAPELTPVYRHILYKYRATYPKSNFGNPYYPPAASSRRKVQKWGYPGLNSGVVMLQFDRIRSSKLYAESLKFDNVKHLTDKYSFKGHLGDQDFFTLLGYEFPALIYRLDCIWNRQLCTWWKEHGYSDVFDHFFHCEGKVKLYHGNCNTRVPE
ncbi:xyloside xylosyltransferase 1 [Phlebotomus papatasi]|uniref:xyloside xylosyltransferase 1 n=1 Tax=Phlebotomus papatasi TaxID=29031 RepID=UPI0024847076|nr:xyloside xylosyltransferase 1 [Phlebotomus papatasi]